MRRFEFSDGKSNKFWEIEVEGCDVVVRYGRIGTNGQTKTKSHGTTESADTESNKQIASKVKKGYAEVLGTPSPAVEPPAEPPATPVDTAPPDPATPRERAPEEFQLPKDVLDQLLPDRTRPGRPVDLTANAQDVFSTLRFEVELKEWNPELQSEDLQPIAEAALARLRAEESSPDDPVVEGLVACILETSGGRATTERLFDSWVATRSLGFAIVALVESMTFYASRGTIIARRSTTNVKRGSVHQGFKLSRSEEPALQFQSQLLDRTRSILSYTEPEVYEAAAREVEQSLTPPRAVLAQAAAFLFPTETLAAKAFAVPTTGAATILLPVAQTEDQLAATLATDADVSSLPPHWLWTAVANLGAALAPLLVAEFEAAYDIEETIARAVACMPTDPAITALFARANNRVVLAALEESCGRFPRRALRLLAPIATTTAKTAVRAKALVSRLLQAHPELASDLVGELPDKAAKLLERLGGTDATVVVATAEQLPELLRSPPWLNQASAPGLPVLKLQRIELEPSASWESGERKRFAAEGWMDRNDFDTLEASKLETWTQDLVALATSDLVLDARLKALGEFLFYAPDAAADRVREAWESRWHPHLEDWMLAVVSRHEGKAAGWALEYTKSHARHGWDCALPIASTELAVEAAAAFARKKTLKDATGKWLRRHPEHASVALIPRALGKGKRARADAEAALLHLGGADERRVVLDVAQRYGGEATAAIASMFAVDPTDRVPKTIPTLPRWFDPAVLSAPRLRTGDASLGSEALRHLATMVALSTLEAPYPGLAAVAGDLTPASLDRFAWELFELWVASGSDPKQKWAFIGLGLLGGDASARRLTPLIRRWPSEGGFAKAELGLNVLAAIGSDVALMHLDGIAAKVKSRALQLHARERISKVADELGLTAEDLADRLVPDLGLEPGGSLSLDYGPRQFKVGFDQHLQPFVLDATNKRLKNLPKPGKKDDATLAEPAHQRWKDLKKDARAVAKLQVARLERAMCTTRRWASESFRALFVEHPLLIHVVRRLVWGVFDDQGSLTTTFRVAEDGSLADVDDEEFVLASGTSVGIAHAVELPAALAASWGEGLADYEIIAPFEQLGREIFTIEEDERSGNALRRVNGNQIDASGVLSLLGRGWTRGEAEDAGFVSTIYLEISDRRIAELSFSPGFPIGYYDGSEDQTFG